MKDKIRNFIISNFMFDEGSLGDDDLLFETGIIDSMGFIKLLAFIDKTFNLSMDMSEISIDNFNTLNNIVKSLERKINR
ncbi:MAG: acyl carrier protein [Candidatus Omnitrophica bacterium]|nr:acyl carrier protein [Candidatus Omnitrophota bacterium]